MIHHPEYSRGRLSASVSDRTAKKILIFFLIILLVGIAHKTFLLENGCKRANAFICLDTEYKEPAE